MRYTREDGCRAWLTYGNLPYEGLRRLWEDHGGSAEAIFDRFAEDPPFIREYGAQASLDALRTAAKPEKMHKLMCTMSQHQMRIMSIDDICYPDLLREISDPPVLLYYQGNPDCLTGKCITMVGSRSASPHGLMIAHDVAKELAQSGVTIVSGFALGIDTACHEGCLAGGGTTCAVMACGLDVEYPSDSNDFRRQILDGGGVTLSEFPPGSRALGWHFAIRNRIMSGLSRATMMMECKRKSGSMLTVQHALDQGREVYAYPGQPGTPSAEGAHALLREGATYFSYAEDILTDLGWRDTAHIDRKETQAALPPLTTEQRKVLTVLAGGEQSFDQLAAETGLDASELSGALTMLQLLGLIHPMPGKAYMRV